jgi:hypothetical protein
MKNPMMKTALAGLLTASLMLEPGSLPLRGQPPELKETSVIQDEFGSGGWLALKIRLGLDQLVTIHASADLESWTQITDPVLSHREQLELHVPMEEQFPQRFFRVQTIPAPVSIQHEDDTFELSAEGPITVRDALGLLARRARSDIFLADVDAGHQELPRGSYQGRDIEDLAAQFGVRVWTPAFPTDDPALARRFPDGPREMLGELPDLEPGEGVIEDRWPGDQIQERPDQGPIDPPIGERPEMPFVLDIPDLPPGTPPEPIPDFREPGTHLRLILELRRDGGIEPLWGYEVEGDALPEERFPMPDIGSTIWVVRSPVGAPNALDQIFFIGTGPDPFFERAYDPPFRGIHGVHESEAGVVRIPVPVPELRGQPVWEGLSVELYLVREATELEFLTPDGFLRNEKSFERVARLEENDLRQLIEKTRREEEARQQPQSHNSTLTQLHSSGPRSKKFNFVIIGDGFRNTTADQNAFNDYVNNVVMTQLFSQDVHLEILNAINVFRINTFSQDSGVTQVNSNGVVTTARNTALMFRYSGNWNRCWMEPTPFINLANLGTELLLSFYLNHHVPEADMVAVVLNETSGGGCARSSHFAVTLGSGWGTFAHEFGHNPGGLGDEYQCNQSPTNSCGAYTGNKPGAPNLDNTTSRANVKWSQWIPSWRPVPTGQANIADNQQDVGIFAGATVGQGQWWTGIYRPSWRGRMNNNTPVNNPVGYTRIRDNFRPKQEGDFRKSVVGDFDGDGLHDLVILDDRQLSLHRARLRNTGPNDPVLGAPPRSVTAVMEPAWYNTGPLRNTAGNWLWVTRKNDILLAGDFDGDGRDDLYVINLTDWNQPYVCMLKSFGDRFEPVRIYATSLPGWTMKAGDEFYVADINGDGRSDLLVYNGKNWSVPHFLMLRSAGTSLQYVRRYDHHLPNWEMGKHEKFHVGDFTGNGRDDLAVLDTQSWNQVHLRIYASVSGGLSLRDRYYGTIQTATGGTFWQMRRKDRLHVLDYDNDGTADLAIFNGFDWGPVYLGMMRVAEGQIVPQKRYDNAQNNIPGWQMRRSDSFRVADVNGDGRQDLVVYNASNWSTQYLGILRSTGSGHLQGTWQSNWIGGWNLGAADSFHVADFRGTGGWDDLIVFNKNWLGLLRSHSNHYKMEAIYPKWIHNHRYHPSGLW